MNEQSTPNQSNNQQGQPNEQGTNSVDQLLNELNRLGGQLIEAIRTAWNSDQRKELEVEISKGISSAANSLSEGLKQVSENESARNLFNKAEEVMSTVGDQVRNSKVAQEAVDNLRVGIQSLNDQLAKFNAETKKTQPSVPDESQEIKVEKGS